MSHAHDNVKSAGQPTVDHADADAMYEKANGGKITEVQGNAHFHETVTAAPLNPWSKTSLKLYMILLVAALNATASGFDGVRIFPTIPLTVSPQNEDGKRQHVANLGDARSPSSAPSTP